MEEQLRREIVAASHRIYQAGWVANHDGNLSARLPDERFLLTPTAVSKGDVCPEWLIVTSEDGTVLEGTRRPFSEFALHRVAYQARPEIGCVIHAHPPTTTGFSVAGVDIGHPFMAEPVVSLGSVIPTVPFARPGDAKLEQDLVAALKQADVVILERHGVLSVGGSFEQAFLRMELLEHQARISLVARQLGGVRPLPEADVAALGKKGRPGSTSVNAIDRPNVGAVVAEALGRLDPSRKGP